MTSSESSSVINAPLIPSPGANMVTHLPKFEYDARSSSSVVAPTTIAFSDDAKKKFKSIFDFC